MGDLSSFWVAQELVAAAFARLNHTATLTGVGTFIRQGITLDNAQYDFLVLGGGSLLQKSHTYRALLFSNSRDSRGPVPVFYFGTGLDDDVSLFPLDKVEEWQLYVQGQKLREAGRPVPEGVPEKLDLVLPPAYSRNLKIAATIPAHGGVRGVLTATLFKDLYSQSPIARVLGDPVLLADKALSSSIRTGLPRFDRTVYLLTPGTEPLVYGTTEELVRILSVTALELTRQGAYVILAPLVTTDLPIAQQILKYSNVLSSNAGETLRGMFCLNDCQHVLDMSQYLAYLKVSRALITFRLRGAIAAIAAGTPFLAIGYRFKHLDFADTYGLTDFFLRLDKLKEPTQLLQALPILEANRPMLKFKYHVIVSQTEIAFSEQLNEFAKEVIIDSRFDDHWTAISQTLVGYPPVLDSWHVGPTHGNVVFLSLVSANIPGAPGVSDRVATAIQIAESQFHPRKRRQLVVVCTQLTPEILDILNKALDGRLEELEFIFTTPRSLWNDIHTWMLEFSPWYTNSTFYFRDILYESHKQSTLWAELEPLRQDKTSVAENLLIPSFVGSHYRGFTSFVIEQELYPYPRLSPEQIIEVQQWIQRLQNQQNQQQQNQQPPENQPNAQEDELPIPASSTSETLQQFLSPEDYY